MAIRYKALTELYQETQRKVTAPAEWQQFLTSACRNYRLSFDEQLLVYIEEEPLLPVASYVPPMCDLDYYSICTQISQTSNI